jgi:hypothetical protein
VVAGIPPGNVAVGLSAIAAGFFFFPPAGSIQDHLLTAVGLVLFIAIGLGTAAMGEGRLRAQRRTEAEREEAHRARVLAEDAAVEAEEAAVPISRWLQGRTCCSR